MAKASAAKATPSSQKSQRQIAPVKLKALDKDAEAAEIIEQVLLK